MKEFYHRHLPHWQPRGAVFFVTFRLKNSLPDEVIECLREEREREKTLLAQIPASERGQQSYLEERRYFVKWDAYLDKAEFGPRWLSQPEIADIVKEAMHYRDRKVFDLHTFCIMSNHVHAVFEPISRSDCKSDPGKSECHSDQPKSGCQPDLPLSKIMQSLKRHTARQANIILGREGVFWQDESYDHVIRDNEEYIRIINYVLENPVKAGLACNWNEWRWTYCKPGILK
ncbi:MAG TPA: transposase [Anaerolineales bacterium]|nr:transposase [Anaerolineales bacterium]